MRLVTLGLLSVLAAPAFAESHADAAAGEAAFRKCQACHVVQDASGNVLAGRSGRTGPNLFGVVGRTAGTVPDFSYKASIIQAGEKGLVWNEEEIAKYLADPSAYLQAYLGDGSARSGMSLKIRNEKEAMDLAAFLATFTE